MRFRGILLTTACAVTMAGCGGDEKSSTSTSSTTGGTTTTGAASDDAQVRGVTREFLVATAAGAKGTTAQRARACLTLKPAAKAAIESVGTRFGVSGCEETLRTIGTLASADQYPKAQSTPIDVKVTGTSATAQYAAPLDGKLTTVTLEKDGSTWLIAALPTSASVKATASTVSTPSATPPTTTPSSSSTSDPAATLANRIPPNIMKYCKPVTGELPEGVLAGLTCEPFEDTEVNYALFDDIQDLNKIYAADDGGPKTSDEVAGTRCKTPTSREGTFSNETFGIGSGRVRCWTLSDGRPRFQWFALEAGSPLILAEATEGDKVWGSLYRIWSEEAGPIMNRAGE